MGGDSGLIILVISSRIYFILHTTLPKDYLTYHRQLRPYADRKHMSRMRSSCNILMAKAMAKLVLCLRLVEMKDLSTF